MPTAKVTTKGQVTIPKDVREHLGVATGDRISFIVQQDRSVIVKPITRHVQELGGVLRRSDRHAVSVEEMDERVAKRMKAKFGRHR